MKVLISEIQCALKQAQKPPRDYAKLATQIALALFALLCLQYPNQIATVTENLARAFSRFWQRIEEVSQNRLKILTTKFPTLNDVVAVIVTADSVWEEIVNDSLWKKRGER